jgi:hypothetical protein
MQGASALHFGPILFSLCFFFFFCYRDRDEETASSVKIGADMDTIREALRRCVVWCVFFFYFFFLNFLSYLYPFPPFYPKSSGANQTPAHIQPIFVFYFFYFRPPNEVAGPTKWLGHARR